MSDNTEKTVRESSDKIRVETQVKRGEGTRDEDRIKVKVRGDDPDKVVEWQDAEIDQWFEEQHSQ